MGRCSENFRKCIIPNEIADFLKDVQLRQYTSCGFPPLAPEGSNIPVATVPLSVLARETCKKRR